MLDRVAAFVTDAEDRVSAASHIITLQLNDSEVEIEIDSASAINQLILSYAITVHKAQGSEFNKVFFILHQSHNTMIQRELLYTGVTRAAKELYVICEPDTFDRGVKSQRIKGSTLVEKAEYFKGLVEDRGNPY
jgi:ATP-dependent exoDNAse (exonuclease V) alpha subunit